MSKYNRKTITVRLFNVRFSRASTYFRAADNFPNLFLVTDLIFSVFSNNFGKTNSC